MTNDLDKVFPLLHLDTNEKVNEKQVGNSPSEICHRIIAAGVVADLKEYETILNSFSEQAKNSNEVDLDHILKSAAATFDKIASTKFADLELEHARRKSKLRQKRKSVQSLFCSSALGLDPSEFYVTSPSGRVPDASPESGANNAHSVQRLHNQIKARALSSQAVQHRLEMETVISYLRKELEERASIETNRMERDQKVEIDLLRRDITTHYDRQLRNLHLEVSSNLTATYDFIQRVIRCTRSLKFLFSIL
jgi:hypothetical protein